MNTVVVGFDDGTKSYLGRNEKPEKQGNDKLAEAIVRNWERMKVERKKTETARWEACAYMKHRQNEFSSEESPVIPVKIYNSSGIEAFEVFVNGYHGNLISSSLRWFKLTFTGENYEDSDTFYGANDYLELCETKILEEFNKSEFYGMDKLATRDAAVQGTSAEWIIDDVEHGVCIYDVIPPWDFWIAKNHNGRIDTLYYQYKLTAQQAQDRFGDKIPKEIKDDLETDNANAEHVFLLAIYPRKSMLSPKGVPLVSTSKPFAAVTYCKTSDTTIDESGYDEFPLAVHVWERDGTSVYGKGLVMRYIEELKRLNALEREHIIAVQKLGNPPMTVPENMKGRFSTDPGARNYTNNARDNRPEILQTVQDVGWLSQEIGQLEEKIKSLFYNDLFNYLMRQDKVLTATQVQAIKNEELSLLSSVLGTTQYMKINPIVKRTFKIMSRAGRLPKPPKEMVRVKNPLMRVELDGPLAKSVKVFAMQNGLQAGLEWITAFKQLQLDSTLDNLEMDDFFRKAMFAAGVPHTSIRELRDRDAMRQQKEQLMQQQMQMEQLQQASEIQRNLGGQSNLNNAQGVNQ